MTLPKLRELAVKAKAYRPPNNCREHPIVACGACAVCLGAQRAVEDIAAAVDVAFNRVAHPPSKGTRWVDELPPTHFATIATRMASYFGSPGPVAAFEAGVREMCNG